MREKKDYDFSEWHLAYFAYVDEKAGFPAFTQLSPSETVFNQGGHSWEVTAILARWTGAVKEEDRPYNGALPLASDPVFKHLENVWYLGGTFDRDTVKKALTNLGAVSVIMKWNNLYYSHDDKSFYRPEIGSDGGHMVTIIGWDDNYSKLDFTSTAPENGAWLVKNSWGEAFGNSGYFWLSYSDPNIQSPAVFIGGDGTKYDRNYQYDPLGWTIRTGEGDDTHWGANVFAAKGPANDQVAELLQAFSFYAVASDTAYKAEIWTGVQADSPRSGTFAYSKEGTLAAPGYHTIEISPVMVNKGEQFSIVLKLTTPGSKYPIPVEYAISGYSDNATASAGESFVSIDGEKWNDLTFDYPNTNVCIKAFSSDLKKPEKPLLSAPVEGTAEVTLPLLLETGPFVPGGDGGIHKSTFWQVGRSYDFSGTLVVDEESPSSLTSREIGMESLTAGTRYYWRVRFKDSNDVFSDWSDIRSFTTATEASDKGAVEGCNALPLTPFVLGLLVPLFLLRRK